MGNILFVIGIGLVLGHQKTLSFFARKEKFKGTACFLLGVGLILARYPLIGFVIELYGILSLFGDFFGVIVGFVGAVPVVSFIFLFFSPALFLFLFYFPRGDDALGMVLTGEQVGPYLERPLRRITGATQQLPV